MQYAEVNALNGTMPFKYISQTLYVLMTILNISLPSRRDICCNYVHLCHYSSSIGDLSKALPSIHVMCILLCLFASKSVEWSLLALENFSMIQISHQVPVSFHERDRICHSLTIGRINLSFFSSHIPHSIVLPLNSVPWRSLQTAKASP